MPEGHGEVVRGDGAKVIEIAAIVQMAEEPAPVRPVAPVWIEIACRRDDGETRAVMRRCRQRSIALTLVVVDVDDLMKIVGIRQPIDALPWILRGPIARRQRGKYEPPARLDRCRIEQKKRTPNLCVVAKNMIPSDNLPRNAMGIVSVLLLDWC